MKFEFQLYWGAEVRVMEPGDFVSLEQVLKSGKAILAEIFVDGKRRGIVEWNGKRLSFRRK